jgi:translation initiation factor IF-2
MVINNQKQNKLLPRPPIVVVMGHVDHGKTTLLDYIRKTNLASTEVGGITQSIGAYVAKHSSEVNQNTDLSNLNEITFIDTPGHEAFFKIRQRGAKVADLGILVVAADEGLKPQSLEALQVLRDARIPFIVAINKIDKNNANVEKVKQELMQAGVLLEGFGGDIPWQPISAKTGDGIDKLLDLILLMANIENLTYSPVNKAKGVIIEAKIDNRRGIVVSAILLDGVLRCGDKIITSTAFGKIKVLEDFLGRRIKEVMPSNPFLVLGFERLPAVGEEFWRDDNENNNQLQDIVGVTQIDQRVVRNLIVDLEQHNKESALLNVLLKTDVVGSLEAIVGIIKNLAGVKIISASIGDITDGDIKLAQVSNAIVLGFRTKVTKAASNLAKSQNIVVLVSEIIYDLVKLLEEQLQNLQKPVINEVVVLEVFNQKGKRQILGGKVMSGKIRNKSELKIIRNDKEVGVGRLENLQSQKKDVKEINAGNECGLLFESDILIEVGDKLRM